MTSVTATHAPEASPVLLSRVALCCAVVGTVAVSIVFALLGAVPRGEPAAVLDHVNERPWFWMRLAGILGMLAWVVAFSALARLMNGTRARTIAGLAQPLLVVAVAVFAVDYAVDGFSIGVVAEEWANGSTPKEELLAQARLLELIAGGTSILSQALLGLALLGQAVAQLFSTDFPKLWTWLGVVGCAGWFLGGSLLFAGVPGVSFSLFVPFSMVATVWVAGVGIVAWRSVSRRTRQEAPHTAR